MKITWKKNIRRIPDRINMKVKSIGKKPIVVAGVKKISIVDIRKGLYKHLGFLPDGDLLTIPPVIIPPATIGKFSQRNMEGEEVVRRDLPKVPQTFSFEAPDWGDWANGSHEVSWVREIYRRDFIPPHETEIRMEILQKEGIGDNSVYTIKFVINDVLEPKSGDFEDQLFFNLNLMLENVGIIDVHSSIASREDFLKTTHVNWQLLPPGEREETIKRIISLIKTDKPKIKEKIVGRYDMFLKLKPQELIIGSDYFRRYFGAKLADDLVIFENLDYGNAVYVMYGNWKELSKKSRLDLLSSSNGGFDRIVHVNGWEIALTELIKAKQTKSE